MSRGLLARSPSLWICFNIKCRQFDLFPLETWIGGQDSVHRNASGDRRRNVIDWHPRSANDRSAAQDLGVRNHGLLRCLKTLQPFLHFLVERGQIDGQKLILDGLRLRV